MGRTLWLIGMMGSGKTTVAPLVATVLDRDWVDADEAVEHLSGRRIPDLFAESEAAFREVESEVVEELAGSPLVVACGGGVVTSPDSVEIMRRSGLVVWLDAPVEVLETRVGDVGSRPLLADGSAETLRRLHGEREPLYRAASHAVVAAGANPDDTAAEVVNAWNASLEE